MKSKSIAAFLIVTGMMLGGGCRVARRHHDAIMHAESKRTENLAASDEAVKDAPVTINSTEGASEDLSEREEIRRHFTLKPDARVSVHGINGLVRVETIESGPAEILIVRSAKTKDDLQFHKINIERSDEEVTIRTEDDKRSIFSALSKQPEGRQRVILKLPRQTNFEANGVNGNVTASELRGKLDLNGINGQIKVTGATGNTEINGVNGGVDVTFAALNDKRIRVDGVNGNIELRFTGATNADLNVRGVNGNIDTDLPNVQNQEEESKRGRLKARIGNGGSKIEISGVNGNVDLVKAEKTGDVKKAEKTGEDKTVKQKLIDTIRAKQKLIATISGK